MVKRTAMLLVVEVAAITAIMIVGRRDIVDLVVSVGVGLSSILGGFWGRVQQDYTKDRPRRIVVVILGVISEIRRPISCEKNNVEIWALLS